ncbi:MAG: exodeoxyribonuclease III [Candidatus Saccharimonadales bacterium]
MKIYSWNVNGIRAVIRKELFTPFIQKEQPDILCLQETKAKKGQAEIDLPDYTEFWYDADKAGYSGTAIFTKIPPLQIIEGLPRDIIDGYQVTGDTFGDPNREGRVLAAEFDKFWLVTVYTPNAKRDLGRLDMRHNHWDKAFLAYMQQLEQTKPVLFCGDLNVAHTEIDLANPKANTKNAGFTPQEREGFQHIIDAGFIDTFRLHHPDETGAYTWWSHFAKSRERNVGWRIDYFLVSEELRNHVVSADIHPAILGSDHCPVSIELNIA